MQIQDLAGCPVKSGCIIERDIMLTFSTIKNHLSSALLVMLGESVSKHVVEQTLAKIGMKNKE